MTKPSSSRLSLLILLGLILISAAAVENASPQAEKPPDWAYPVDPPGLVPPVDDGSLRHVPDSFVALTLSQVRDSFAAPDWHPNDHPPMPEVVAHGRKPSVMACAYCHRAEGTGGPENTSLAGLPADYIVQQMADFRSGARTTSVEHRAPPTNMIASAKAATPEEIAAAAAYFSSLKLRPHIRVIESERAPKTGVHGWHLIDLKTNETEPIGRRIVEFPADLEQFVSRDTRAQFMAYVPPGSVERGRILATTGGAGRTVICATCHGPDLRGLAAVMPRLAGRSPSYLVRQLYDLQHGLRAGPTSVLMKPTVEKLTLDEMIDLAAYAASLPP
jgi:cytochrome c553